MYVKINSTSGYTGGNAGTCSDLVNYLDKENKDKSLSEQEYFFNNEKNIVISSEVIYKIDHNVKGLKSDQAKFFMLTVNPSPRELQHMAKEATGRNITDVSQMTKEERGRYDNMFKEYVNNVMDGYAKNFNRDITVDNIVYYAKIEQERTYKGTDKDVKEHLAFSGQKKEGLQTHAHVVVSRMDKDMKMSLSPLANSRGSNKHQLNGKSVKVGFDRDNFKEYAEKQFDKQYEYQRQRDERFQHMNHYVTGKVQGRVQGTMIQRAISADQTGAFGQTLGAINNVKNIVKDLKMAMDVIAGIANPTKLITNAIKKALTRVASLTKDAGHTLEL